MLELMNHALTTLPALTLVLGAPVLAADPAAVTKVRAKYQALLDAASERPDARHTLVTRHVVPGTGPQTKTVEFHYSEADDGEDPKTGEPRTKRTLDRVVLTWNVAALPRKSELMFVDGALAFAHEVEASGGCANVEVRWYLEQGALVRVRTSPEEGCTTPAAVNRDASFTKIDQAAVKRLQREAAEWLAWWKRLDDL